jgi:hypothetical protein
MSVPGRSRSFLAIMVTTLLVLLLAANPALAYLGPGTGLEFVPYFMAVLATVGVAFLSILLYPIYTVIRFFRGAKEPAKLQTPEGAPTPAVAPDVVNAEETGATPN